MAEVNMEQHQKLEQENRDLWTELKKSDVFIVELGKENAKLREGLRSLVKQAEIFGVFRDDVGQALQAEIAALLKEAKMKKGYGLAVWPRVVRPGKPWKKREALEALKAEEEKPCQS